ncbi:WYL domain-containing protein [Rapidithrix thailandica]|uniref:WYL domain-containing protein n=1 Tax=Rapidithrix thailandica TaxID=413964 RepID=A0AAW9S4K1_9BACT
MPSSKLAFFRYLLIDRMLRNKMKKYPTKEEILEACHDKFGVRSISTIEKDLSAMRLEFDAPIEYSKRYKGYYYTDLSFKLLSVNLSDENLVALKFVETFLEEFRAMPIFSEFSDAVDKVLDGLEITRTFNNQVTPIGEFVQIDKSAYVKGSDILSKLIKIVSDQHVVKIQYQKFGSSKTKAYTVHPYLLKEYSDLWYLIGYVEEYQQVRTFGIDRISEFEDLERAIISKEEVNFDAESFFMYCLGITALDESPNDVVLSFAPRQGYYLKTQPIHSSQEIMVDSEEEFRIRLKLVNNFELKKWILSFGSDVEVVSPEELRKDIREEITKSIDLYQ